MTPMENTITTAPLAPVMETSAERRESPSDLRRREKRAAERMAAARAAERAEQGARSALVREAVRGLDGEEKRAAAKEARAAAKHARAVAARTAVEAGTVKFTMPALDDNGKGRTDVTVTYTDPSTGLVTRAALTITVQVRDSLTLRGAGLAALED